MAPLIISPSLFKGPQGVGGCCGRFDHPRDVPVNNWTLDGRDNKHSLLSQRSPNCNALSMDASSSSNRLPAYRIHSSKTLAMLVGEVCTPGRTKAARLAAKLP